MTDTTGRPRRSPAQHERKIDAERSRRLLLDAALAEFAAKGYAGARVQDIADRAGVNKQLINYYFGGKAGLYREIGLRWLRREEQINDPALPLDEVVVRYLREALDDSLGMRLDIWRGFTDDPDDLPPVQREDLSDLERRQAEGELADDLDPAAVMLALMAMVAAPIAMPLSVRRVFGLDPEAPEFQERYAEQLRRIVRHLAGAGPDQGVSPATTGTGSARARSGSGRPRR